MPSENRSRALCSGTKCERNIAYDLEGIFHGVHRSRLQPINETRIQKIFPLDSSVLKTILFLSSQNVSLLLLPEEKICYLLPLDKELPTPRKLLSSDHENAEVRTCKLSNVLIIDC